MVFDFIQPAVCACVGGAVTSRATRSTPTKPAVQCGADGNHPIVKADGHVRHGELVVGRSWQPFQVMAQIVTKQARRPALKRR